jgi:hypothetical protein
MGNRTIYSCDRCGIEWKCEIVNGYGNHPLHLDYEAYRRMDLCSDCYNEFYSKVAEWKDKIKLIEEEKIVHSDDKSDINRKGYKCTASSDFYIKCRENCNECKYGEKG